MASYGLHAGQTSELETALVENEGSSGSASAVGLDVTEVGATLYASQGGHAPGLDQMSELETELAGNEGSSDKTAVGELDVVAGSVALCEPVGMVGLRCELLGGDGVGSDMEPLDVDSLRRTMAVLRTAPPVSFTPTTGTKPPVILSVGVDVGVGVRVAVVVGSASLVPVPVRVVISSLSSSSSSPGARFGAEASGSMTSTTR